MNSGCKYVIINSVVGSIEAYKFNEIGIIKNKKDNSKITKVSNDDYQLISNHISNYILLKDLKEQDLIIMIQRDGNVNL